MLDNKDIKFFQENGYLIKKSEKIQNIKYFENIIKHEIFKIKKIDKKKFQLDKLHKFINLKELNNIRLELIKRFNLNRNNVKIFYWVWPFLLFYMIHLLLILMICLSYKYVKSYLLFFQVVQYI